MFFKYGSLKDKILSSAEYFFNRFFELNKHKEFDAGIFVSKTHLELSRPFVPKENFIIPPGVDLDYFKNAEEKEDQSICFIGSMSYYPNVYAVLYFVQKIYPLIKKEIPDIKFYIVGRNPEKRVIKIAEKDKSVIVTGTVTDVRRYLSHSAVFVNPITIDDGGIKNKVLEAMAMGKAIVSTSLGARDIGCEDGKHLYIADGEKEFAERVVELIRDENERRRIGRSARKFVEENYSWDKKTEELYKAMRRVVENRQ